MSTLKKLLPFFCLPVAALSIIVMVRHPEVPPWQIVPYTMVMVVPCGLILFWKSFDLFFGFAPAKAAITDHWSSVTPWIGWLILAAMLLINHFARPPADF
ncbi:MAG: hypothetical protein VX768_03470 [Planctomycetota bacterium]|nr:hypothetical protein [Planctomycetota bacterium]